MLNRFCPKCGSTQGHFIEGFCLNCYLEDHKVLNIEKKLELPYCAKCNRIKLRNEWFSYNNVKEIRAFIESKIKTQDLKDINLKIKFQPMKENILVARITGFAIFKGIKIPICAETELILKKVNCPDCSRIAGGYFEGILQLRSTNPKKIEMAEKHVLHFLKRNKRADALSVIIKKVELKNGFDYYIGSKKATFNLARELATKLDGSMNTSTTQMGKKDGKPLKRLTACVRFE